MSSQAFPHIAAVMHFAAFFAVNVTVASIIGLAAERGVLAWRRLQRTTPEG
jgi:hypothetical protein